jgi:hypothetical protein
MDPISTLNQVMLLLRQQLAEKTQRQERASSNRETVASPPQQGISRQTSPENGPKAIQAQVSRLRAAGVTDERQLFRVAVEGLLLRDFGSEVSNDPGFQQMSEWVCACLDEEPGTREMLRKLIDS